MTKRESTGRRALILTTLAACAGLLAWGATAHLATAIFPLYMGVQLPNESDRQPAWDTRDDGWFEARNIFGPDSPMPGGETALDPPSTRELACDGALRLLATVNAASHPEHSLASIAGASGSAQLVHIGDFVGGFQVSAVRHQQVSLTLGDHTCTLMMFIRTEVQAVETPQMRTADGSPERRSQPSRGTTQRSTRPGIRPLGDNRFTVARALIDQVLTEPSQLASTRLVPVEEQGQVVGFEVYARAGSLLSRLGLQNGDRVATINGVTIDGPDSARELLRMLRTDDHWQVELVRHQRALSLEYDIL